MADLKRNKKNGKKKLRLWQIILFTILVVGSIGVGSTLGIILGTLKNSPKLEDLEYSPSVTTKVYDIKGRLITNLHAGENRTPVLISQIPQYLQDAVVAVEDDKFYSHHGINFTALIRALLINIREGDTVQGASTITQQLVKNVFLSPEKLLTRKIKEATLAIQLERTYTKEEILELYLNQIYFGHGAYGVEAAAQTYFGKDVSKLSLAESAMIAGVTRGPRYYSPYFEPDAALKRRAVVLYRMYKVGFITKGQMDEANKEPIKLVGLKSNNEDQQATYFIDYIREELTDRFGADDVYKGGLNVYTTLDLDMQKAAETALNDGLPKSYVDSKGLQQPQGAVVSVDTETGHVLAMVGGRGQDKYNRATQALRQPGSSFKPFVYATALEQGYTPNTTIKDEPISYPTESGKTWSPTNFDSKYHGTLTIRQAIEQSINVVAVKLCDKVGIPAVIRTAKNLGISSLVESGSVNDRNLSMALGGLTKGISPLEMATAYSAFANGGYRIKPITLMKVEDRYGNVILNSEPEKEAVLSEKTAFDMTDMMRGVIERGTGRLAQIGRPAAGKTGTTSDNTNAWFVGFTPDVATAVWIGNDEQSRSIVEHGVAIGSGKAALIWSNYMKKALAGTPIKNFKVPENEGVPGVPANPGSIDSKATNNSGAEVQDSTETVAPPFDQQASDVEEVLVDSKTGQLATEECPPGDVLTKLYDIETGKEVDANGKYIDGSSRPVEACSAHPGPLLTQ